MTQETIPSIDESLDAHVEEAISLLRLSVPKEGADYYGCFSGGKDSVVIKELAKLAGVPVTWHYNVTTIDPPELVYFIRDEHPDVMWNRPDNNFFTLAGRGRLVPKAGLRTAPRGFPTRRARWCCEEFKERVAPEGSTIIIGVRAAESPKRAVTWQPVTWNTRQKAWAICPIVWWPDAMVWAFIRERNLPYCKLYDEGWTRLGCIGCPQNSKAGRLRDFERWPGYERKWKKLFRDVWDRRTGTTQRGGRIWFGDRYFDNWEEMWEWWVSGGSLPKEKDEPCQGMVELFS